LNEKQHSIESEIFQSALLLPTLVFHLRLHLSLTHLERQLSWHLPIPFKEKFLLRNALTHPSFSELYAIDIKRVKQSYRHLCFRTIRNVSPFNGELFSGLSHNQRLEFLGDAVLEYICTSHLFFQFPNHNEGSLTVMRSSIVSNKMLAHLAKQLHLEQYILYAKFPDLIDEGSSRQHMLADCFESLLGAIFIDQGLDACREFFGKCIFSAETETDLLHLWLSSKQHPVQQASNSDRYLITQSPTLQKFCLLEDATGFIFRHIQLLAQAFTHPSVLPELDLLKVGTNQRLEFLGDAILQLLVSWKLFLQFPDYTEGQLTLLRSSLVNNNMISDIATELGFEEFIRFVPSEAFQREGSKAHRRMLADVFESYLAALYLDHSVSACSVFLEQVLFPRINSALIGQVWLDPKTSLQQQVLAIFRNRQYSPVYRILGESGPPHMRTFTVGVYLLDSQIGIGCGDSRQSAEQEAAKNAMICSGFHWKNKF